MSINNRSGLVIGALLILAGLLFLTDRIFNIHVSAYLWPLAVIGTGGAFFLGMFLGGKSMGGLAIPGSIISGIGMILLVQNTFGLWNSWSYAWALIICFVGIGMLIHGQWSDLPEVRASGFRTLRVGLVLFAIFGGIFGILFSLSGAYGLQNDLIWAVVLMVFGSFLLISRILKLLRRNEDGTHKRANLFWPVVMIGAGALWLLVAIRVLPSQQAAALFNLWPLLLIAAGVDVLIGRNFPLANLLMGLITAAAMFVYAFAGPALGLPGLNVYSIGMSEITNGIPLQHINGSGKTAIEGREVSGFDRITIKSTGEAEIVQGENEGVVIEAEENLLPYLTTNVLTGELVLDVKPGVGITPTKPIRYKITVKSLKEVRNTGAAQITIRPLNTTQLNLDTSGAGSFDLVDLKAGALTVSISGAGSVEASGVSDQTNIRISGTGSVNAPDLKSSTAVVSISGMGSAKLWVTEKLDTRISGAGSVSYYGAPTLTQDNSGLGGVTKMGNK